MALENFYTLKNGFSFIFNLVNSPGVPKVILFFHSEFISIQSFISFHTKSNATTCTVFQIIFVINKMERWPGGDLFFRAGHLRYFFIFSLIKNDFLHYLSS